MIQLKAFANFYPTLESAQFDYPLPVEAIAQEPAQRREDSRLMVINRKTGEVKTHHFSDLPYILDHPWHFVRNNVSVLKARIFGHRPTGGKVECLLLRPSAEDPLHTWWALLKPAKKLDVGDSFTLQDGTKCVVKVKGEQGSACIQFISNDGASVNDVANRLGLMPLPPYIKRSNEDPRSEMDKQRYQTIYADPNRPYAAAAPTAGLHFSESVLEQLQQNGHHFHDLTLHVGLGTFKPIEVEDLRDHQMHSELYEIPSKTLKQTHHQPILAVGTTSMRAIEDAHRKDVFNSHKVDHPYVDQAQLFIYPPAQFRTDALITNFHLPKSTLLCLVSAFLTPDSEDGIKWLREIYLAALKEGYKFYSYGDAMLII